MTTIKPNFYKSELKPFNFNLGFDAEVAVNFTYGLYHISCVISIAVCSPHSTGNYDIKYVPYFTVLILTHLTKVTPYSLVKIKLRAQSMKYLQLMVASLIAIEFCAFVSSVDLQSSIYSDPGRYYAKSNQQKQRKRLKNKVGYLFRVLELGYIFNFD